MLGAMTEWIVRLWQRGVAPRRREREGLRDRARLEWLLYGGLLS
jgi:hypothetical protein